MRLVTLIVGVLLGVLVIFLRFAGIVGDIDTLPFVSDNERAGHLSWLLMVLWTLGVTFVMVWPLIATLVFATAALLALVTIVRINGQVESYGNSMVLWLALSAWVGTVAFLEWQDRRKPAGGRRARIADTER